MKSLISIDMRMSDSSGIGTYITNLVPLVIEKLDNVEFNLIGDEARLETYGRYPNVSISHCVAPIYSLKEQVELKKIIPKNTIIFWSPHYNIPLLYKGKLLVTIHDVFHLAMKQFVHGLTKKLYAAFMFNRVKYKADKILTVSQFTKEQLLTHLHIPVKKIVVTHNGINKKWFVHNELKSPSSVPYLLYVGNVKPHKNLVTLIKAFKRIESNTNCDLIIVGKKDGFITSDADIQRVTEQYKTRIHFTGFVSDNVLMNYIQHASLFVFPSLYEGFGLPPLEAMASGIPVAVSDIPPLHEVCGDVADFFNPLNEEEMAMTILNALRRKNNEQRKRSLVNQAMKFNWNNCAEETANIIQNLLK